MRFIRETSIRNKVLIPPLIMVMTLGALFSLTLHGFNKQNSIFSEVHEIALERTTLVNEYISLSESVQSDLFRIAVIRFMNLPEKEIQPIHEDLKHGLNQLKLKYGHIVSKWRLDPNEKKILQQMRAPMEAFIRQAQQATAVASQHPSLGIILIRSAAEPFDGFRRLLTEFLDYQNQKIVHIEARSQKTIDTVKVTTAVVSLSMAFIAILLTIWIGTGMISRPVRSMTDVMDRLAKGELSIPVSHLKRRDEIGSMAEALEVFRKNAIEKRAAEEALRLTQFAIGHSSDPAFWTGPDAHFIYANEAACDALGYSQAELLTMTVHDIDPDFPKEAWADHWAELKKRKSFVLESNHRSKQGKVFPVEVAVNFLEFHGNEYNCAFARDITERRAAEARINASLAEKEVLLREIHHRVKNNMQVITSLLRLQSDRIKDQKYADIFKESQDRIKSMALVHEKLYQSKDLARIDFREYVEALMMDLFRSYGVDSRKIKTIIAIDDVSLGPDHAIPCGLIINELVSNSLKHAFPQGRKGEIRVTFRSIGEGELSVNVSDNGIGFPENLDFKSTKTLGLVLVRTLVEHQLEGQITLDRQEGTAFDIQFMKS